MAAAAALRDFKVVKLSQLVPVLVFQRYWGAPGRMRSFTSFRRLKLLCLTAKSGSLANLELAVEVAGLNLTQESVGAWVLGAAAGAGHLELCAWLRQRGCPWRDSLQKAARMGHWAVCEWLLAHGCPWDVAAVLQAGRGGHIGLMVWLLQRRPPGQQAAHPAAALLLKEAVVGCDLEAVQRLVRDVPEVRTFVEQQRPQGQQQQQQRERETYDADRSSILSAAASSPKLDWRAKVEWLLSLGWGSVWSPRLSVSAGCPDILHRALWLRERGFLPRDDHLYELAVRTGDVAGLQRLVDMGLPVPFNACWYAAQEGQLATLQFLMDRGAAARSSCALAAFETGHLEVLRFLHGRGVVLDPGQLGAAIHSSLRYLHSPVVAWAVETLGAEVAASCGLREAAAATGSVESLSWLHQRGCPWADHTFTAAVTGGSEEAIEFLLQNGCPVNAHPSSYLPAARHGDLATLHACLLRLGCPRDKPALFLACAGDRTIKLPVLQWLVEEGGCDEVDWGEAVQAAVVGRRGWAGSEDMLVWLEARRQQQRLQQGS
ncbi:hypothetical protein PLESTM_001740400 [Pleodorina starrii]|nr:hypothetical protein PLESTM_001740400 [Pleodorina starrii]